MAGANLDTDRGPACSYTVGMQAQTDDEFAFQQICARFLIHRTAPPVKPALRAAAA
jgi:hypothetical protein